MVTEEFGRGQKRSRTGQKEITEDWTGWVKIRQNDRTEKVRGGQTEKDRTKDMNERCMGAKPTCTGVVEGDRKTERKTTKQNRT